MVNSTAPSFPNVCPHRSTRAAHMAFTTIAGLRLRARTALVVREVEGTLDHHRHLGRCQKWWVGVGDT